MASIHTERVRLSPSDQAAKIRRCARQIQYGQGIKDLLRRGYTEKEVKAAQEMLRGKR